MLLPAFNMEAKYAAMILTLLMVSQPGFSIKCRRCFPPMDEDTCKKSDDVIDCHNFKALGYDSCIQVYYPGNHSMARTCYRGFMCKGAREWCKRYGPCVSRCCHENMCNASGKMLFSLTSLVMSVSCAMALVYL